MQIEKLKLKSFRNFAILELSFHPQITVLVGSNGQGKTNLLEAISLLVLTKSFRTNRNQDLISFDQDFTSLNAEIKDHEKKTLELIMTNENSTSKKQCKIDDVKLKTIDFIGTLNAVIFEPEDLNLINAEPSARRKYLDMTIAQVSNEYVYALAKFNKVLKVRNRLLYNIRENLALIDELNFWDEQILNFASEIIFERKRMINFFNTLLTDFYQKIANQDQKIEIIYETKIRATEKSEIRKELRELFDLSKIDDINQCCTTTGPHREDMYFSLDGRDIRTFGSRGEFRSVILSLKLAEIEYIKEIKKEAPILLLDDVFSELDESRRQFLLDTVKNQQTIITTTDLSYLEKFPKENLKIVHVNNGMIENQDN